jgi:hypothetical protein
LTRRAFLAAFGSGMVATLGTAPAALGADDVGRELAVWKSPTCGCCQAWVEHMAANGFKATVTETRDLDPIKQRFGVPERLQSCHTARIGGYTIEGHVPAADVAAMLEQKPDIVGLTVPGMPLGSPGMEVPSGQQDDYDVVAIGRDGSASVFSRYRAGKRV